MEQVSFMKPLCVANIHQVYFLKSHKCIRILFTGLWEWELRPSPPPLYLRVPVHYSGDHGAVLSFTQKVVVKINGAKKCETALVNIVHSLLSLLLGLSPIL